MSVYVDQLIAWGKPDAPACFKGKKSCHMYADDLDELHYFAAKLGMKRSWFQQHRLLPHYDLTPAMRAKAVRLGAIEQSREELAAILRSKRESAGGIA
jgi:hypothetical protein